MGPPPGICANLGLLLSGFFGFQPLQDGLNFALITRVFYLEEYTKDEGWFSRSTTEVIKKEAKITDYFFDKLSCIR